MSYGCFGSIESVTGWSGAHDDDPPSAVSATIPSAKHITGGIARCFDVPEGDPMTAILRTKGNLLNRMSMPLEVRFADQATGAVEGYASTFGGPPDTYGDIISPKAFARTLAEHKREGTRPAMLWAHDPARPIGRWEEMAEDDVGLFVRGRLNLETQGGREAHAHLRDGDVSGMSIGFVVPKGGSQIVGASKLLTDIDLVEISIVAFAANRRARVSNVKSIASKAELVDILKDAGLAKSAAARIAAGGWPALAGADHEKAIDLAAEIRRATDTLRSN